MNAMSVSRCAKYEHEYKFRIHDMNTLYKIGDLKYNGKYIM